MITVARSQRRSCRCRPSCAAANALTIVTLLQIRMKVLTAVRGTSSLVEGTGQSLLPSSVGMLASHLGLEMIGPSLLTAALLLLVLYEALLAISPKWVEGPA